MGDQMEQLRGDFDWSALKQVSHLEQENLALKMKLEDQDHELSGLRAALQEGGPISTSEIIAGEVRETKLQEMAKKNRMVNLALQREKEKSSQLSAQLASAKAEVKGAAAASAMPSDPNSVQAVCRQMVEEAAEAAETAQRSANDYKERCASMANRLEKEQGELAQLKRDNDKLSRALQKEVGETVPLSKILEDGGDWRGRAQQISLLKDKLKEMKAKVASVVGGEEASTNAALIGGHDGVHRQNVERIEKSKKADAQQAEAEAAVLREEVSGLRKKLDASIARRGVVENECRGLREKINTLLEKTQNDDKLVDALKSELVKLRKTNAKNKEGGGSESGASTSRGERGPSGPPSQAMQYLESRCAEQEIQIKRQEVIILQLTEQVDSTRTGGQASKADLSVLQVEVEKMEELVELFKTRLQKEEASTSSLTQQLQSERIKVVDLQRRLEGSRPNSAASQPNPDKVQRLEGEVLKLSAENQRLTNTIENDSRKAHEELQLYQAMIQQIRAAQNH